MLKKLLLTVLIGAFALTAAACSSNNDKKESAGSASPSASASAAAAENPDLAKSQAYIAARLAEEKVDGLFHQETSEDGKPILNPFTPDKESAAKFLNAYMDPALTDKILAFYLTEEKAGDAIVVKNEKYFSASIRATSSKNDVTIEGQGGEYKLTTPDGGVYTVTKNADGKYILSDFSKK